MKMVVPSSDPDANSLILTSAFYHPDENLRKALRQSVADWVDKLCPHFTEDDIRNVILQEKGTILEPFRIDGNDLEMAVTLAMAAFSKKVDQKRCRIVSRETIGSEGGLVITSRLKTYFAERYQQGKYKRKPRAGFTFLPAWLPASGDHKMFQMMKSTATLYVDEDGFTIRVPWPHYTVEAGELARDLQIHSRISRTSDSFDQLGLRVETERNSVMVRTGSPEAQIKLMANMMNGETIILSTDSDSVGKLNAFIVLYMPEEDELPLKTIFTTTGVPCDWIKCTCSEGIKIKEKEMVDIAKWLPPHESWINTIWNELL